MSICSNCFDEKGNTLFCPHCGYKEAEGPFDSQLNPGEILNAKYIVGRVLGLPGTSGFTYLAKDQSLDRYVAIKEFFPPDLANRGANGRTVQVTDDRQFQEGLSRFLKEARFLAGFNHPNIVRVNEIFEENETAYLVMNYAAGLNLLEYLDKIGGQAHAKQLVKIMLPVIDGLSSIHKAGVLHLDIKPQNIYISEKGQPLLLDFGAAKYFRKDATKPSVIILTHGFAPYEQYGKEQNLGPWTDLYACAATMYMLLSGKTPPNAVERRNKDTLQDITETAPGISANLARTIMQALAINADQRPQTAAEFKDMLQDSPEAAPLESIPTTLMPQEHLTQVIDNNQPKGAGSPKYSPKGFTMKLVLACLLLIAVTAGGYSYYRHSNDPLYALSQKGIAFSESAFIDSITTGDLDAVKLFLNAGMSPDAKAANGKAAVVEAISRGNLDILKLLDAKGANFTIKDQNGNDVLEQAIHQTNPQVVEYLFDRMKPDITAKDSAGLTLFERALRAGNLEAAKIFQIKGADINLTAEDGSTLLDRMLSQGNATSASFLKSIGAKRNVNRYYKQGQLTTVKEGPISNTARTFELDFLSNGDAFAVKTGDSRDKTAVISHNGKEVLRLPGSADRESWYVCYPWDNAKPAAIHLSAGGKPYSYSIQVIGDQGNGQIGVLYDSSITEGSAPRVSFSHNKITLDFVALGIFHNHRYLVWNQAVRGFESQSSPN